MVTTARLHAQQGELKSMKNAMVRYILNVSSKKIPFKSIDIVKQCLRGEQKTFLQLFPEVQEMLDDVSNAEANVNFDSLILITFVALGVWFAN